MTREGTIPLESYRLAQYSNQVPCYICEEGNTYDAEFCRYCFAPMALAHQANSQKVCPRMLGVIGSSGSGKTVYLGTLMDILSRQPGRMQMVARGAFSISLQQSTASALARGEFPVKTPNEPDRWNWVHCQVRAPRHRRPIEVIMPDMAGEALLEEVEHPHSYHVIRALLSKCCGVLLVVDALRLKQGDRDQDYFAMKLLSYLVELEDDPKEGWPSRPIGIVLAKADEAEDSFVDPKAFLHAHASGLWQLLGERHSNFHCFATGVAGACAYQDTRQGRVRVPLRIEPRGVVEPFEWLVGQLKK